MQSLRVGLAVCAFAVLPILGCDEGAEDTTTESGATACTIVSYGGGWWNQSFTEQQGRFHVELSVTPTSNRVDLVVGLSNGAASTWSRLAAIARFNPQGYIDARAGSAYRADTTYAYQAGVTYYVRLDVDMQSRTYSVWLREQVGARYTILARNYPFRTEQASVTRLNNVASFLNPETSPSGTAAELCGFAATADATTADGCVIAATGSGFGNGPITTATGGLTVHTRVKASHDNIDGVVGFASGAVDAYNDYAASIRFYTNGRIEARDGDTYRADTAIAYRAGQEFNIAFVIDLPSKTYSVFVQGPGVDPESGGHVALARGYKFRTQQAGVTQLDRIAAKIETTFGRIDACGIDRGVRANTLSARYGTHDVVATADGGALISNGVSTTRINANHATVATLNVGGKLAIDSAGNVYVARIANGTFTVSSYTATFTQRWTTNVATTAANISDIAVSRWGDVLAAVGAHDQWFGFRPQHVLQLAPTGAFVTAHAVPTGTTAAAVGAGGYATAREIEGGAVIDVFSPHGTLVRTRNQPGDYYVTDMAFGPDDGLVIGGHVRSSVDFGTGTITPYAPSPDSGVYWDAFIAALAWETLATRYAYGMYNEIGGISVTNEGVAISSNLRTQLWYIDLTVFDASGAVVRRFTDDGILGHFARTGGSIELGAGGLIYANVMPSFGGPFDAVHPFLLIL